jgi:hypothetical protein
VARRFSAAIAVLISNNVRRLSAPAAQRRKNAAHNLP